MNTESANTCAKGLRNSSNDQISREEELARYAILQERRRRTIIQELEEICIMQENARLRHAEKMQIEYSKRGEDSWRPETDDPLRATERGPMMVPEGPRDD